MSKYTVLAEPVESSIEAKNSDFLTFLHPVSSREEALAQVEHYRQCYADASHVCWAYIIGNARQPLTQAFSDAGEPSGTAGKPMLHVLTERDVGNSLAVVVRYFGGVKLGAGGLVRAYSGAVSDAVNRAVLQEVIPRITLRLRVDFAKETNIRHLVNQHKGNVVDVMYGARVELRVNLPAEQQTHFVQQVTNETAGAIDIATENS